MAMPTVATRSSVAPHPFRSRSSAALNTAFPVKIRDNEPTTRRTEELMPTDASGSFRCPTCRAIPAETRTDRSYPEATRLDERERSDRILGCMVGGAIGDAIGRFLKAGASMPIDAPTPNIEVGGATQLSLFTAEGMVRMLVRYNAKGIGPAFAVIRHAYDRWLFTQGKSADMSAAEQRWAWGASAGWPDGWLVRQHELHHRRSHMATAVRALRRPGSSELGDDRRLHPRPNASSGTGGLVRAAPGGLLVNEAFAFETGVRIAGYTHGHPDAFLSAGVMSALVCRILLGASYADAIAGMRGDLLDWPGSMPFHDTLDVLASGEPKTSAGARAVSALLQGATAARDEPDAIAAVGRAAAAGGTAAAVIAGQLAGVLHGAGAWPVAWKSRLEVAGVIDELSSAMAIAHRAWLMGCDIPGANSRSDDIFEEHPVSMLLWSRFPGW